MYRIYDKKKQKWIRHNIFLTQNGDLAVFKSRILSGHKVKILSNDRYQYHMDIGIRDKENHLIHEGDICAVDINSDKVIKGLIIYFPEIASFVFVDYTENKYYPLTQSMCKERMLIIGNCFDNAYLIPELDKEQDKELTQDKILN